MNYTVCTCKIITDHKWKYKFKQVKKCLYLPGVLLLSVYLYVLIAISSLKCLGKMLWSVTALSHLNDCSLWIWQTRCTTVMSWLMFKVIIIEMLRFFLHLLQARHKFYVLAEKRKSRYIKIWSAVAKQWMLLHDPERLYIQKVSSHLFYEQKCSL